MSMNRIQGVLVAPSFTKESMNISESIAEALSAKGVEFASTFELAYTHVFSADEGYLAENALRAIERADFIIADLTDENPNVMYEVGFAHALRKPVLPIVKRGISKVPSVIAGYVYLVYDPSRLNELNDRIGDWVERNRYKWKHEEAVR